MPSRFQQRFSTLSTRYRSHLLLESDTFTHPGLGSGPAIRLISFTNRNKRSAIEFNLVSFPLSSLPSFTALSYTWGSPVPSDEEVAVWNEPNHLAFCNNQPIAIRKNLHDALQSIRTSEPDITWLWVDAVCINQSDSEERTSQVEMMSDIYGMADLVFAWLGQEDESSRTVHKIINTFGRGLFKMSAREGWDRVDQYGADSPELIEELGHCIPQDADWLAWNRLFKRNWFHRTWILQEVSLATKIRLVSGQHVFVFDEIHALNAFFDHSYGWKASSSAAINPITLTRELCNGMLQRSRSIRILEDLYGTINQGVLKLLVLSLARGLSCSDPKDKVYGNLGIVKNILGAGFDDTAIPPDYNNSVQDLYIRTASYILTKSPIISLLCHVEDVARQNPNTLPSWVPDFTLTHTTGRQRIGDTVNIFNDDKPLYYTYLSGSPLSQTLSISNNVLFVNGHLLGQMSEISIFDELLTRERFITQINLISSLPGIYLNGQTLFEAYWRTILGDFTQSRTQNTDQADIPSLFIAMIIHGLLRWFDNSLNNEIQSQLESTFQLLVNLDTDFSQLLKSLRIPSLALLMQDIPAFVHACLDQDNRADIRHSLAEAQKLLHPYLKFPLLVLFRTETEYLGLGPKSSRPNDQIWVFEQSRVPFVLRAIPDSEYFQFVGECYVHGIMRGELVDKIKFKRIGLA